MKTLITIINLLVITISVAAQGQISSSYTEIKKAQFDSCINTIYLTANTKIIKKEGILTIPVYGNNPKVFKDDYSDDNFHEFEYIGDIKETNLSLVKHNGYNKSDYYIVNRSTGMIDTLIGIPVFAKNMRDFACINNPGTDEKQHLQICELANGSVKIRAFINGMTDTFFEDIFFIDRNSIATKDHKGNYWRLNFNISTE
ncbi:hypothetical protein GCM10027036_34430 [Flavihumibacter cheonanensis]|uniref:hypothetical protein n=1 Tax=Flavihumibacter cheonanensis TaxID=1442385 RepID=UPI001EF83DAF|nr:hypothetical protein [Flavihumibacter cheonanensis]MCG7754823.1 hypothetical protein [Flavihumibacter cheonanensis]